MSDFLGSFWRGERGGESGRGGEEGRGDFMSLASAANANACD